MPVEIGQELRGPLPVGLVLQLFLQEVLVLPEELLGQGLLDVQAVFDAVEALLGGQIKELVDADAEDLRQPGQQGNIGHGRAGLPLGHRLGSEAQLLRQILLGEPRLEAKLSDFLSKFHGFVLLFLFCLRSDYRTEFP